MNQVLCPFINKFMVIYFDNILIYSRYEVNHLGNLREVFEVLLKNKSYVILKNYSFMTNKPLFLSFVISVDDMHVNGEKVWAFRDWLASKIVSEVHSFHGLLLFIRDSYEISITLLHPLLNAWRKGKFDWERKLRKKLYFNQRKIKQCFNLGTFRFQ